MTIKDVEKLTGLTAKSIRYYEEKGLLTVERNRENSYRSYSEENVNRLKWIKLLRRLDFSIEEIETVFKAEPASVGGIFEQKAELYEDKIQDCSLKKELCQNLIQDYGKGDAVLEGYEETLRFLEGEDFEEIREELKELATPSLSLTIVESLVLLGPIGWLFLNIGRKFYAALMLNGIFAVGAAVCLTLLWTDYFRKYRHSKRRVKAKNRKTAAVIPVLLLAIVLAFGAMIAFMVLAEKLMAPEGWLFYQQNPKLELLTVILIIIPVMLAVNRIIRHVSHGETEGNEAVAVVYDLVKAFKLPALILWLLGMYICLVNVTYVTEDKIIRHTTFHPAGTEYSYADVEKAEARFGSSVFSIFDYKRKGRFSYTIYLDGKKVVFSTPSANEDIERYNENTYLELEEFDSALMKLGAEKEGNLKYKDYCDLDEEYVDRFVRIIENKTK